MAVEGSHYEAALAGAGEDVAQGAVGAGRGMSAFGVKGGIGTASRLAGGYCVGALVLANFGTPESLTVAGRLAGPELVQRLAQPDTAAQPEKGSIIMILATDAPQTQARIDALRRAGK